MSDARNSSGNIRGGGARQTGGSGRTQKNATGGNKKGSDILGLGSEVVNKKVLTKRNLQLLTMSKQLALEAKAACLNDHTEEEYIELNVPIPDPDSAMRKLKAMTKFTSEWHDADFRERWLKHVLQVWKEELKEEFEAAAKAAALNAAAKKKWESDKQGDNFVFCNNPDCGFRFCVEEKNKFMKCPCKEVAYCGKDCQKKHWKVHKTTCQWHASNKKEKKSCEK
jgi:hypothetical protein